MRIAVPLFTIVLLAAATSDAEVKKKKAMSITGEVSEVAENSVTVRVWGSDGIRRAWNFDLLETTTIAKETGETDIKTNEKGKSTATRLTTPQKLADLAAGQQVTISYMESGKAMSVTGLDTKSAAQPATKKKKPKNQ